MAWTNPTTQSTGTLITATIWNTDIVDNLTALRGGSLAITSQAAGDVIYASSSTQLGRVAIGTSGYVLTSNGSAPAWSNTPTLTGTNFTGIPASGVSSGTFAGSTAAVFGGTLAWGGGSAISSSSNVGLLNANNSWTGSGAHTFSGYIAGSYSGNLWMQASGSCIFMIDSDNNSTGEAFYWRKNASGSGGTDLMSLTEAGDLSINATSKLYLDGGSDTYIYESGSNTIDFYAGGSLFLRLQNGGAGNQYVESGVIYNTITGSPANVHVASNNVISRSTSSIRYKHDIATLDTAEAYAAVMAMRPITYRGKTDEDQRRHVGFVAEEMQQIAPLLCTYDEGGESGTPNYVTYDRVTAYLVAVVQKQQAEIDALKAQIKEQK